MSFWGDLGGKATDRDQAVRWALVVLAIYGAATFVYTWPLPRLMGSEVPSDPADPILNAAVLWWNATTIPFTAQWWNAPHYFPTQGVAGFTENLAAISLIATPVFWLTKNPIAAYNVAYFLTFPLSAFAVYLLVSGVTSRRDAAFLSGFAFAFTPYRTTEIAHIQSLSIYWLPIGLASLHRYIERGRRGWLALFAVSWPLQALSNGYFMLYGAILLACWLLYFCTTHGRRRAGAVIVAAWAASSLPLLPIFLKYAAIHDTFGLVRDFNEILAYGATPKSWVEVSGDVWFWRHWMPQGKDDLFPGVTAVAAMLVATVIDLARVRGRLAANRPLRLLRLALWSALLLSVLAIIVTLAIGPWSVTILGIPMRTRDLTRALIVCAICGGLLVALSPGARAALHHRSPAVFYTAMTVVIAVLCCGPMVRTGDSVLISSAPYRWLMSLPGFGELRVPPRFWMLGVMCLSIAAGLAYANVAPRQGIRRALPFAIMLFGLVLDGWMPTMRTAIPPESWSDVEPAGPPEPILELPLGPNWDWDATYRAAGHRRRVFNGVSGYDPPHYIALRSGLEHRDPALLRALASLGSFDVVVRNGEDKDGQLRQYLADAPGAAKLLESNRRTLFRIPQGAPEVTLGAVLPIAKAETFRFSDLFAHRDDRDATEIHDGNVSTAWTDYPQQPGQWIVVDLGGEHEVGGVTHAIGRYVLDFPRRLAIELSVDEAQWTRVWEGPTASAAFLALVRGPRQGAMRFAFPAHRARFVRLLQLERDPSAWRVAEIQIHAP